MKAGTASGRARKAPLGLKRRNPPTPRQDSAQRVASVATETQDSFALSRNGFQESASRLASSKCPSSNSLPTHLKYSQRNDASGNWYTRSLGTHKSNFLAEINAEMIVGLRSSALLGHPDDAVRVLMLSERLRNLEPRPRSSEAFFSSDFRANHSNETPITIPVKKTNAN